MYELVEKLPVRGSPELIGPVLGDEVEMGVPWVDVRFSVSVEVNVVPLPVDDFSVDVSVTEAVTGDVGNELVTFSVTVTTTAVDST